MNADCVVPSKPVTMISSGMDKAFFFRACISEIARKSLAQTKASGREGIRSSRDSSQAESA